MRKLAFPLAATMLASCSVPPPPEASFLPDRFRAFGTEPFWSAEVVGDSLTYVTPEDYAGGAAPDVLAVPAARTDYPDRVILRARLGGSELTLTIVPGECNDGMSDATYPWHATRVLGAQRHAGCAAP